jgi:hypothetical protein
LIRQVVDQAVGDAATALLAQAESVGDRLRYEVGYGQWGQIYETDRFGVVRRYGHGQPCLATASRARECYQTPLDKRLPYRRHVRLPADKSSERQRQAASEAVVGHGCLRSNRLIE